MYGTGKTGERPQGVAVRRVLIDIATMERIDFYF
jgi:hypothetical protein